MTSGLEVLAPGRHLLSVGFPNSPEPRGEAQLKLEYFATPPT